MTKITLPNLNKQGKANEWSHVEGNDVAIQTVVNGEINNENIAAGANIARSKLEGGAQGIAGIWKTPNSVATEQTRESVVFGTLSTPDEITGIVVPTNGFIQVGFAAQVKVSVESAGRMALFVNAAGAHNSSGSAETTIVSTSFRVVTSYPGPNAASGGVFAVGSPAAELAGLTIPPVNIFVVAGTYALAVKYLATSGSITAKERILWAEVHGF